MNNPVLSPELLKEAVINILKTVYDPEIPVNIYDLGLIYAVDITKIPQQSYYDVLVKMTLTAPGCPVAQTFPQIVEDAVRSVEGVENAVVELVWEPPWTQDNMSEAAKLQLGLL